jgi:uncharacterized membrane protein YccF (DUF307 family)
MEQHTRDKAGHRTILRSWWLAMVLIAIATPCTSAAGLSVQVVQWALVPVLLCAAGVVVLAREAGATRAADRRCEAWVSTATPTLTMVPAA